ncbi:hypothetical protein L5515_005442 [Caenorhabditis briggsae]|uniref:Uncharacterized protein n=1 Tax=Caenorhabditis briggsae TaxID=6238 RepID=A0AAE9JEZ0_CAEBR|nr:hypothetical protein L5515_005442 [Caenorhabditis briggsae]
MKEIDGSKDLFQELASQLEEKPSLEECQLSRKSRYFHRQSRQKSISVEPEKTKKKLIVEESSSDDEMPTVPPPKIRKKKMAETPSEIIEIDISSDDDVPPPTPSPTPTIDLTIDSDDEEIRIPDILPEHEVREVIPERILSPHLLRGRLPTWYYSRKLENEKLLKSMAEKREIREKLEKEREETERKEEQLEKRRFLDRERHKRRREEMKKNRESVKNLKQIEPKNGKKAEENAPKKSKKEKQIPILTDPSVNPSTISLKKVDIVPWASSTKKPRQAESHATSSAQNLLEAVLNTPTSSESSEDVIRGFQEMEIALLDDVEVMEDEDVQILEENVEEPQPLDDLDQIEGLFFEEHETLLKIPDAEIEQIDANDDIDTNFLSIIMDDRVPIKELDRYLNS